MSITNELLVQAIGQMHDAVMTSTAPCNHSAVGEVLAVLNAAILSGKEVELANAVHAWTVATYPDEYARWQEHDAGLLDALQGRR